MILDFDTYIYNKLSAITELSTAVIVYWYPNDFKRLPVLAFNTTQSNSQLDYFDDVPKASDCTVDLDLYVAQGVDDGVYIQAIGAMFDGLFFNLDACIPVPDPDTKVLHRHLTFSRQGMFATDLV